MGCGSSLASVPTVKEEAGFDVNDIYLKWAKYTFQKIGKYKSGYEIEIDDRRVRCQTGDPIFKSKPENKPRTRVIYSGTQDIRNQEDEMSFRFKKERKTKSVAEICFSKNLSKNGGSLNIPFKYPKLDERSGIGESTTLTGQSRQGEEMEMTWEVDTEIKAKSPGVRKVELCVNECHLEQDFTLEVAFRGALNANLWDAQNGKRTLVSNVHGRAEDVLIQIANFRKLDLTETSDEYWAMYKMKGICMFRYAIEQHVRVSKVEEQSDSDIDDWD